VPANTPRFALPYSLDADAVTDFPTEVSKPLADRLDALIPSSAWAMASAAQVLSGTAVNIPGATVTLDVPAGALVLVLVSFDFAIDGGVCVGRLWTDWASMQQPYAILGSPVGSTRANVAQHYRLAGAPAGPRTVWLDAYLTAGAGQADTGTTILAVALGA
jgi:hypothetical protein